MNYRQPNTSIPRKEQSQVHNHHNRWTTVQLFARKGLLVDMSWSCGNYLCLSSSSLSSSINSNELTRFNICKLSCEYKEQRRKDLDLKRRIHISACNDTHGPHSNLGLKNSPHKF